MFGSALTLLTRSLREDSRLARPHLLRILLVFVIVWWLVIAEQTSMAFGAPGLRFFNSITTINLLFITLAGISFFATAITEEKEEQTLGLLKMAGIRPVALLLGKSTSRMISGVLLLSVQFPFILLAITLGGVTSRQIVAAYCALFVYLVFVANLGLLSSVVSRRSSGATWMTGVLLALFLLGPWLGQMVFVSWIADGFIPDKHPLTQAVRTAFEWLRPMSVWDRLYEINRTGFDRAIFGYHFLSNLVLAAGLFTLSCAAFNVFIREDHASSPPRGVLLKRIRGLGRLGTGRAWNNALAWKDFHFIAGGSLMMILKFLLYGTAIPGLVFLVEASFNTNMTREDWGRSYMIGMLVVGIVELALFASRMFHDELKWNTWSGLLLLPHSTATIAYSKAAGCLLGLIPAVSYFILGAVLYPEGFGEGVEGLVSEPGAWWFSVQCVFFLQLTALLSLYIKWGALPVSFAITYVGNGMCLSAIFLAGAGPGPSSENFVFGTLAAICAVAIVVLHVVMIDRLRAAAGK